MYDAIIVGARCASASTAMLLARKGHSVLLVDRSTFPSDIPHGHLIHRHGPKRLHDWGCSIESLPLDVQRSPSFLPITAGCR